MTARLLIEEAVNAIEMFIAIGFLTQYLDANIREKRQSVLFSLDGLQLLLPYQS